MAFLVKPAAISRLSSEMIAPTPTTNPELPFRVDGLRHAGRRPRLCGEGVTGLNFFSSRGDLAEALPYRELRRRAVDLAGRLAGGGLERGDRVAIVAETSPDFVTVFFACQYAGLVPVPLPLCINIGGHDAYVERLRGMLVAAGARLAVAPADLVATLAEAAQGTEVTRVATAARSRPWPAPRRRWSRSAPTSPATSSTPPAAPASPAACW